MNTVPITCSHCGTLLEHTRCTYRKDFTDPLRYFCNPGCRDEYVDGQDQDAFDPEVISHVL